MNAALLLVCIVSGVAPGAAPETVTIYYWGNDVETFAPDLIQDFETRHDGSDGKTVIKVIMGQSATFNKTDAPQRLLTAVAGGSPPDVVWFDRFAVGEWAARGAFQSLQPFLERDLAERPDDEWTLKRDQFFQACWDEANYKGELFAVPSETDNRALFYNQDILDKYANQLIPIGCVDPTDPTKAGPPCTWVQLKKCAEILTQRDANGRLERVGFIPQFGNSWLYIYGWLNGGEFMSEDGLTCTLNSPEIVDALVYMTEVYDVMIPPQVTMVPVFLIFKNLGWYNTLKPLWVGSFFGSAFYIFLLRQFMKSIPTDLEDSAKIDGGGYLGIYRLIILPLIKPALAAIAIFTFMGTWNDFMGPLIYLNDQRLYPLSLGLFALQVFGDENRGNFGLMMAASVLMTLPVIFLFFAAQRQFIQGVTLTGLKG